MGTPGAGSDGEHYFSAAPTAPSDRRRLRLSLPDLDLDLVADRGVFSSRGLDPGTKLLLSAAPPPPAGAVELVDLGCGYGPIAVALALRSPLATVWAVDINPRALALTAENAAAAGVSGRVRVAAPEDVPPGLEVAAIYSNPPIRIGRQPLHDLLSAWLDRLAPGGRAWLVVHKHLGSDSLARWLRSQDLEVERLVSRLGYRVLEVGR